MPKPFGIFKSSNSNVQLIRHKTSMSHSLPFAGLCLCTSDWWEMPAIWISTAQLRRKGSQWSQSESMCLGPFPSCGQNSNVKKNHISLGTSCLYGWKGMKAFLILRLSETFWNFLAMNLYPAVNLWPDYLDCNCPTQTSINEASLRG